jgi:chromosome segregation ATPase
MFNFRKKENKAVKFNKSVLRNNDISLLILDERWNGIFNFAEKTEDIIKAEEELKSLLILQSKLLEEQKTAAARKKELVANILALTQETFENNNEEARTKMNECEQEIKDINERLTQVESQLEELPQKLKEKNLELLGIAVEKVYFTLRTRQKKLEELDKLINETRDKLKGYIDEKETLAQENNDSYSYFHDLLGSEELERLDKLYFDDK